MRPVTLRTLNSSEFQTARELAALYPDSHARYVVERLPTFFSIQQAFDPPYRYASRQKIVLGAYDQQIMVGTVAVERYGTQSEETTTAQPNLGRFTKHEIDVFHELEFALAKTYIGAPEGSLYIHSLAVDEEYRGKGLATKLLDRILNELSRHEREQLYAETVRRKKLERLFESCGFSPVKKTFSISERLEFGYWGSTLFQYRSTG